MKSAKDLTKKQLENIVNQVQAILWLDVPESAEPLSETMAWDPNKEWDSEHIEMVAEQLAHYGLRPSKRKSARSF